MVSVALVRPVWWLACRSARFVTALALMALLLGTGGARTGGSASAEVAQPLAGMAIVLRSTVEAPPPAAATVTPGAEFPGTEQPSAADAPSPGAGDEFDAADADAPAGLIRSGGPGGQLERPPGRHPRTGTRSWPDGDEPAPVAGPRAPPLG